MRLGGLLLILMAATAMVIKARAGVAIALVARMSRIVVEVASVHLEAP